MEYRHVRNHYILLLLLLLPFLLQSTVFVLIPIRRSYLNTVQETFLQSFSTSSPPTDIMHCAIVPISTIATVFTPTTHNNYYYESSHSIYSPVTAVFHRSTELRRSRSHVPLLRCRSSAVPDSSTNSPNGDGNKADRERQLSPMSSISPSHAVVQEEDAVADGNEDDDGDADQSPLFGNSAIFSACFVGLFTGVTVVLFNYGVHEIRDLCWGGIPDQGASWLREEMIESKWKRVILVPVLGGVLVSLLNVLRTATEDAEDGTFLSRIRSSLKPILKAVAACVTLGTGNSLGPEGPSVEIGVSFAKGVGAFLDKGAKRKLSLRAAGSAAGLSSGFNAAVAGCFFAVETVLWPSPTESSLSLTYTTSMVILSAVTASVISEVGLGSEPAFAVPFYDFRSPSELPLYLLLGLLCGLVSVGLSKCTSFMMVLFDGAQRAVGMPKVVFPILGGFAVGLIALAYPEILYWGFQNVDTVLESRPFVNSLSADLLLQLIAAKIIATSLCRASGLVGGYYAPSLFIGAATGMAYGKIVTYVISISDPIFHLSFLEVASPQAYGLVGMAATLAGVCQVPLTAVLLLFELTQDYRIVLPLLGAVGLSSWITSGKTRKKASSSTKIFKVSRGSSQEERYSYNLKSVTPASPDSQEPNGSGICELESSLCLNEDSDVDLNYLANDILVSQAMRTRYVTVLMNSYVTDAVSLMVEEKQSFAVVVDGNAQLVGQLTLSDIQQFIESFREKSRNLQALRVSELCSNSGERCSVPWTVTPSMSLFTALTLMNRNGISQLPVILEHGRPGCTPVGLLDRESIDLACRAFAIKRASDTLSVKERFKN